MVVLVAVAASPASTRAGCATVSAEVAGLAACDAGIRFTVVDPEANLDATAVDRVVLNVRSAAEPFGEAFTLTETGPATGVFAAIVTISASRDPDGVLFFEPGPAATIRASYVDPDCDADGGAAEIGGSGQTGEDDFTDVDGDGRSNFGANGIPDSRTVAGFDDDNCYDPGSGTDVANPLQEDSDTECVNYAGATDGTFCATDTDCYVTPGFTTCRADRVGDACDDCPLDYDPDQTDSDGDGIGDLCELDGGDRDGDGVPNLVDNCPTVYNPGQADTGFPGTAGDGIGEACDGPQDREPYYGVCVLKLGGATVPSGDDRALGSEIIAGLDRICQTAARAPDVQTTPLGKGQDCKPGTLGVNGDGIADALDNCPARCNASQVDLDANGIGDACEVLEDWDFDAVLNALDNCPTVFNPGFGPGLQTDLDGDGWGDDCDPDSDDDDDDGRPDDLLERAVLATCPLAPSVLEVVGAVLTDAGTGDGDGIADPGETLTLDLTVRNVARGPSGEPTALHNLVVGIDWAGAHVACLQDASAAYGTLAAGEVGTNPAGDLYRFTLGSGPGATTLDLGTIATADVRVSATADEIAGVSRAASVSLSLDLDVLGDPTGGGPLDGTGTLSEDFEGLAGTPGLVATLERPPGTLADVIPMIPAVHCAATPLGPPDCFANASVNDWHLHDPVSEPANTPDGGRAHSGVASLHMAKHYSRTDEGQTTYRFRQVTAFVTPPANLALAGERSLEFWHLVTLVDDNALNFLPGEAGDIAFLEVRADEDADPARDAFGPWRRLEPDLNAYDHARDSLFTSNCKFDPLDDIFAPQGYGFVNETICAPRTGWSRQGDRDGIDADSCTDTDANGIADCGDATTTGPGFTDRGSLGLGVWVKTRVDLGEFSGRRIQVRWVFSSLAFGLDYAVSYLEACDCAGASFDQEEKDDGWFIDDIKLNGLLESQLHLLPDGGDDVVAGTDIECGPNLVAETKAEGDDLLVLDVGASCGSAFDVVVGAGPNGLLDSVGGQVCPSSSAAFCGSATARVNGAPGRTLASLGPGQPVLLDGSASSVDQCVDGAVLYEYVRCSTTPPGGACEVPTQGVVVQGASLDATLQVAPFAPERYRLDVRCSSQPEGSGCRDVTEALVLVYPMPEDAGEIVLDVNGVVCNRGDTGKPAACDGTDSLTFTFSKPVQSAAYSGFDLRRAPQGGLGSPIVTASCVGAAFGQAEPVASPLANTESPSFAPEEGTAAYYVIAHHAVAAGSPSPAGLARAAGVEAARFVEPTCP